LDAALARSSITSEALLEARDSHLELNFLTSFCLSCFYRQHYALTAKVVLLLGSRQWTMDLYNLDLSNNLKTTLIKEYLYKKKLDNSKIYHKI
ncbi:hypothetical protein BCR34DRAFT_498567, partial [Clohesyomyces aquaticus]